MRHHKLSWHGTGSNASAIYCATLNSGADGKTCICHTVPHSILMQMVVHLSYTVPHSIVVQMVIHLSAIYCATLNSGADGKTCICHTVPHSILMQMVVHLSYTVPHSILELNPTNSCTNICALTRFK